MANVDIPDLELFPARYQTRQLVQFQAGLELPVLHFGMVLMAYLAKKGWIKDWSKYSRTIFASSQCFKRLGTDIGGMQIELAGVNHQGEQQTTIWTLSAKDNIGPYIPTLSAIIVAKKLMDGSLTQRGAMPCLGLFSLQEFDQEALPLGIRHKVENQIG